MLDPALGPKACAAARADGPEAAVRVLYSGFDGPTLVRGPRGHGIAAIRAVDPVARVWPSGDAARLRLCARQPAALDGTGLRAFASIDPVDDGEPAGEWQLALAWLRLGLSTRLAAAVVTYLDGRTVGGQPQSQLQLIKGALADIAIAHLDVHTALGAPALTADELGDMHEQLTDADRAALLLLGAAGFVADGPGVLAHVSELLADAYVRSTR
ncbi:hypothetical protein KZZ52_46270 [Dactylosporangium sp. AC04546]|uniref:hypothetical protein n=1 Tax=Dactylosporangium sp. AC04546 TaxID=2862460 RepID=UPI001EDEC91C|nr:hypothetical protein [Dactylosporangium sp. AC04546]WVK81321.1 hypothetical protein KZZ52_46270 [Dactylosporangium sp. AC04546]